MYGVRIHCSRKAIAAGNNQKREESWKNESLLYLRRDGGGDVQEKIDFLTLLGLMLDLEPPCELFLPWLFDRGFLDLFC